MKKNISICLLIGIVTLMASSLVFSQDNVKNANYSSREKNRKGKITREVRNATVFAADKDYILMIDGKAYLRKNSKLTRIENEKLVEGLKVNSTGKVIKKDGSVLLLKDGEALNSDEKVVYFDQSKMMRDIVNTMDEQYASLSITSRELEDKFSILNAKITLLTKKTDLMNQKMSLMRKHDHAKKMSQTQAQTINDEIRKLEEEMHSLDNLLKELDHQMTKGK